MCKIDPCINTDIYDDGMCYYHYKYGADKPVKEKKVYEIPKVSAKEKDRQKEYKKVRPEYLELHPVCEMRLDGCKIKATEIHHTKGRIGKLLTDTRHFKAACDHCHRIAEDNPQMAKQNGLSKSRTKKG